MDLVSMSEIQRKFEHRLNMEIPPQYIRNALNIELGEMLNAIGVWKWWKIPKPVDKERVLDELADVLAFWLAYLIHTGTTPEEFARLSEMFNKHQDRGAKSFFEDMTPFLADDLMGNRWTAVRLSQIVRYARMYTDASLEEVQEAYEKKMNVNHQRQTDGY